MGKRRNPASRPLPSGMLKISQASTANHCRVALAGTLNRDLAPSLPDLIEQFAARSDQILIDLGELTEIDQAGIRALKRCLEVCQAQHATIAISGLKGAVLHSIQASGCADQPPFAPGQRAEAEHDPPRDTAKTPASGDHDRSGGRSQPAKLSRDIAREREMLRLRDEERLTLREIGERYNLTPERVRQITNRCRHTLREEQGAC